jgi:hypothetical protein
MALMLCFAFLYAGTRVMRSAFARRPSSVKRRVPWKLIAWDTAKFALVYLVVTELLKLAFFYIWSAG